MFLGLALLKFGNPVILDWQVVAPGSFFEALIAPWPIAWGYGLAALVLCWGFRTWHWPAQVNRWWAASAFVWLGWQFVSAATTADGGLTRSVLPHFVVCVAMFALGLGTTAAVGRPSLFWLGLAGSLVVVLVVAMRQRFGGLEETRQFLYSLPNWRELPAEFLAKVSSDRVYGTLVYPNTLAGVILLIAPPALVVIWQAGIKMPLRIGVVVGIGLIAIACLYWSGSKSGWLIALLQLGLAGALSKPMTRGRWWLIALLVLGLAAFAGTHRGYFERGATSLGARLDYWQSAVQTLAKNPLLGSGPGTFAHEYQRNKRPEAEPTKMVHNDFLQQGSDSGIVGMATYLGWILGGLVLVLRTCGRDTLVFATWLGLMAVMFQSCVEFGWYVPAIAWPTTFLLGWLGRGAGSTCSAASSV